MKFRFCHFHTVAKIVRIDEVVGVLKLCKMTAKLHTSRDRSAETSALLCNMSILKAMLVKLKYLMYFFSAEVL